MKNYSRQIEDVMLFYPAGIPVVGLQAYHREETMQQQSVKGKVNGAIMSCCMNPEQFRRLARVMLRTGQAFLKDGYFRVKGDDHV